MGNDPKNADTKALDELTELDVLEWWAIDGQSRFLGAELETVLREQGYLMGALGITEAGLWRLEVLRHEQTKAKLMEISLKWIDAEQKLQEWNEIVELIIQLGHKVGVDMSQYSFAASAKPADADGQKASE